MNYSYRCLACFATLLILFSSVSVFAQEDPRLWDAEGVPLRLGDHLEWFGSSAVNEYGQTCVTWGDAREGYWDIYAQVIAPNGSQIWANRGVVVNNAIWRQEEPAVIAVDDGWIIVWMDWRYGDRFHYGSTTPQSAVFAQKLSMSGERLWIDAGIEIYRPANRFIRDSSLRLSDDRTGGAIIGWCEYIPSVGYNYLTQRINADGSLDWDEPVVVSTELDWSYDIQVERDESGNMLAVWTAEEDSITSGVFAAKVTPSGALPWGDGVNGIRLESVPGNCYKHSICRDETIDGFYLVWSDRGIGYTDLYYYAQRFDVNGSPLWGDAGVLLFEPNDDLNMPNITPSYSAGTQDGFLFSGNKTVQPTDFLVLQKVNASGDLLWGEDGVHVAEMFSYSSWDNPTVQTDYLGGCIALCRNYSYDSENEEQHSYLRAARLNDTGTPLWGTGGISIHHQLSYWRFFGTLVFAQNSNYVRAVFLDHDFLGYKSISFADGSHISESASQIKPMIWGESRFPDLVALENSRIACLWIDEREGSRSIYMQVTDTLGTPLLGANGTRLDLGDNSTSISWSSGTHLCSDGNGGFFVAAISSNANVHPLILGHVTFDEGMEYELSQSMVTDSARGYDDQFHLALDGNGGCFVSWSCYTPDYEIEMQIQRFSGTCEPLWPEPLSLSLLHNSRLMELEQTSDNCCVAVYGFESDDIRRIVAAKIDLSGEILWSTELEDNSSDYQSMSCQSDGNGGMYFCWGNTNSGENSGIYLQHADADGTLQWPDNGIHVDIENGWNPELLFSEQYGLYIIWKDGFGMLAQRIDLTGTKLWTEEGLVLASEYYASTQDVMLNGEGGIFCIWTQENYYGESVLYGMDLSPEGTPTSTWWIEGSGSAISSGNRYINQARLAPFHDGSSIIVWEGQVWGEEEFVSDPAKPNYYYYIDLYAQRIAVGENTLDIETAPRSIPMTYSLHQNYPNPFNPSTTISFAIPKAGQTSLVVYDLLGRTVETLMNKPLTAGNYHIPWNANSLPSGVYFYRLTSGEFSDVKKTILLK